MSTSNDMIINALESSRMLLSRFVSDLTPTEYLHRITPQANCVAWLLGHLTLSDVRLIKMLGGEAPTLPDGFDKRFSRDEGCPQAGEFRRHRAASPDLRRRPRAVDRGGQEGHGRAARQTGRQPPPDVQNRRRNREFLRASHRHARRPDHDDPPKPWEAAGGLGRER